MSRLFSFFKNYLTYSRSEKMGILLLIIILLIVILLPFVIPKPDFSHSNNESLKAAVDRFENEVAKSMQVELFDFDPNSADSLTFCALGFSPKQTSAILRYRSISGGFKTADDFAKVYVVSDSVYRQLHAFIKIEQVSDSLNTRQPLKKLDINSASADDFEKLNGIGPYYARKIIDRRNQLGGFFEKEQLLEIYGIDKQRLSLFSHQIIVNPKKIKKIDLNTITATELQKHPYFDLQATRDIIRYRKQHNGIDSLIQLTDSGVLTIRQMEKIMPYVK